MTSSLAFGPLFFLPAPELEADADDEEDGGCPPGGAPEPFRANMNKSCRTRAMSMTGLAAQECCCCAEVEVPGHRRARESANGYDYTYTHLHSY